MLDTMFEQAQRAFKPVNELCVLNSKTMEAIAEKQKALVSEMINDSVRYAKELGSQKDFSEIYQTHQSYLETVQSRWLTASTELYELMASSQEKASEVIRQAASDPAQ